MTGIHHHNEDGSELIELVDELRNIPGLQQTIPIPQVVVVGQQSSGKSSVLHAISGIRFPTSSVLSTRFPIEIILRRENIRATKAYIRPSEILSAERKVKFEVFGKKWIEASLDNLPQIINEARDLLITGKDQFISPDVLVLEVTGPDQEHLTLIDLPGLIASTEVEQNKDEKNHIEKITTQYIKQERTIVLAVVPAKDNHHNHLIMDLLNPKRSTKISSLGIITHPDVEVSEAQQESSLNLLRKNEWEFAFGWHVLRNLTDKEMKDNFNRDEVERDFFEQQNAWKRINPSDLGSAHLKTKLSDLLQTSISQSLPGIQQEVEAKLREVEPRLAKLGPPRNNTRKIRGLLCQKSSDFEDVIASMLHGSPFDSRLETSMEMISLRAFVQDQYDAFAHEMHASGRVWDFADNGIQDMDELKEVYHNKKEETQLVDGNVMMKLIVNEANRHRGKWLSNLADPGWAAAIFRHQAAKWPKIAKKHTNIIYDEVRRRVIAVVRSIADEDLGNRLLKKLIEPQLQSRKNNLEGKLKELFKPYEDTEVICLSPRYHALVREIIPGGDGFETNQIYNMWASSEAFYRISLEIFIENVANLAIENCLLYELKKLLWDQVFLDMSDEQLHQIGGESKLLQQQRSQLEAEQKMYKEARNKILSRLEVTVFNMDLPSVTTAPPASTHRTAASEETPLAVEL